MKSRLDPKTAQAALRHANPAFTLGKYTQTDNEELLAAQNMMLNSIFSAENGVIQ